MNEVANFRLFRLNLGVFNASADLGHFTGEQHITSSFQISEGGMRPPATTPADAHVPLPSFIAIWL